MSSAVVSKEVYQPIRAPYISVEVLALLVEKAAETVPYSLTIRNQMGEMLGCDKLIAVSAKSLTVVLEARGERYEILLDGDPLRLQDDSIEFRDTNDLYYRLSLT